MSCSIVDRCVAPKEPNKILFGSTYPKSTVMTV